MTKREEAVIGLIISFIGVIVGFSPYTPFHDYIERELLDWRNTFRSIGLAPLRFSKRRRRVSIFVAFVILLSVFNSQMAFLSGFFGDALAVIYIASAIILSAYAVFFAIYLPFWIILEISSRYRGGVIAGIGFLITVSGAILATVQYIN